MTTTKNNLKKGFTLMETILVVFLIGALLSIVVIAVNPGKQLSDARNSQRRGDINLIVNAISQYSIDNNGEFPATITENQTEICMTGGDCTGLIDLSVLTEEEKYLVAIPFDPSLLDINRTGYEIIKSENEQVTVIAPNAERGEIIKVTK
jgi:prepilin-type N-terminal cleavage/methylation domain-containing protein